MSKCNCIECNPYGDPPEPEEISMQDAIAAGDGTLHGAIDHWQDRALKAEQQHAELLDAVHKAIWRLANLQSSTAELILREAIAKAGGK